MSDASAIAALLEAVRRVPEWPDEPSVDECLAVMQRLRHQRPSGAGEYRWLSRIEGRIELLMESAWADAIELACGIDNPYVRQAVLLAHESLMLGPFRKLLVQVLEDALRELVELGAAAESSEHRLTST